MWGNIQNVLRKCLGRINISGYCPPKGHGTLMDYKQRRNFQPPGGHLKSRHCHLPPARVLLVAQTFALCLRGDTSCDPPLHGPLLAPPYLTQALCGFFPPFPLVKCLWGAGASLGQEQCFLNHSSLLARVFRPRCPSTPEKAMAPHSSTLAWKIPWTEEPGRLQSMGSLRDWVTSLSLFTFMHWRGKWQPTPVFLPGESQGRGSLVDCRLWGRTESDTTEAT